MDITIDVPNADRLYIDSNNLIMSKGDSVIAIKIHGDKVHPIIQISEIIGRLIGLDSNIRQVYKEFTYMSYYSGSNAIDKTYIIKKLVQYTGWSYRTIDRYINELINKFIFIYNADTKSLSINDKYRVIKDNINTTSIIIILDKSINQIPAKSYNYKRL